MNLKDLRFVYVLSCALLGLIVLSPTFIMVIKFPSSERFSEFWILGQNHLAGQYPFNISANAVYSIYLGVGNHMGKFEYYKVYLKLRNQTELLQDSRVGTPSVSNPLLEYRLMLASEGSWERKVSFSLQDISFQGNTCRVAKLVVDNYTFPVDRVVTWDQISKGFYLQLFLELWIYNEGASDFQYHNRFLGIWLNITKEL